MLESHTAFTADAGDERPPSRELPGIAKVECAPRTVLGWDFWAIAAGIVLLLSFAFAGCGDDDDSGDSSAMKVNATEGDGTIELDRASSSTGDIAFEITNAGKLTHEFLVLKTDLPEDKLAIDSATSTVNESAPGVEVVGEKNSISPGDDATLAFDSLANGNYVVICNVPGHYGLGMHASFVVG